MSEADPIDEFAFATPDTEDELRELVSAIKHDLGKYVAWVSANLPDESWRAPASAELMDALRRDLLETHKGRDGKVESAWVLWARLSADLDELSPDWPDELRQVEAAVARLAAHESVLRTEDSQGLGRCASEIREAQGQIRTALRALHRRLAH